MSVGMKRVRVSTTSSAASPRNLTPVQTPRRSKSSDSGRSLLCVLPREDGCQPVTKKKSAHVSTGSTLCRTRIRSWSFVCTCQSHCSASLTSMTRSASES
eukprot:6176920-Pleurochrysis_carterae.AAC.5